jgi:hypothetical protein
VLVKVAKATMSKDEVRVIAETTIENVTSLVIDHVAVVVGEATEVVDLVKGVSAAPSFRTSTQQHKVARWRCYLIISGLSRCQAKRNKISRKSFMFIRLILGHLTMEFIQELKPLRTQRTLSLEYFRNIFTMIKQFSLLYLWSKSNS